MTDMTIICWTDPRNSPSNCPHPQNKIKTWREKGRCYRTWNLWHCQCTSQTTVCSVNACVGRLLAPVPFGILGSQIAAKSTYDSYSCGLGLRVFKKSAGRKLGPRQPKYLIGCGMLLPARAPAEATKMANTGHGNSFTMDGRRQRGLM